MCSCSQKTCAHRHILNFDLAAFFFSSRLKWTRHRHNFMIMITKILLITQVFVQLVYDLVTLFPDVSKSCYQKIMFLGPFSVDVFALKDTRCLQTSDFQKVITQKSTLLLVFSELNYVTARGVTVSPVSQYTLFIYI